MPEELQQACGPEPGSDGFSDVVSGVAAEVLETMFFAEAVPSQCSHAWLSSALAVSIRFEGSHSGQMRLGISEPAADSVACAFLGIEPLEITGPLRTQVVLELTNILCGAILSRLWAESKLALGPPELIAAEPPAGSRLHHCFELLEGKLAIWIGWREPAEPA